MASYENNSLTLGSSATLSQNLVIKSNTNGTFTIERQSGEDLLTISAAGVLTPTSGLSFGNETLSTYDEGTWVPVFALTTPGTASFGTYAWQQGYYTRIGRVVTVSFFLNSGTFTLGTGSGTVVVNGLPFSASAALSQHAGGVGNAVGWTTNAPDSGVVIGTSFYLLYRSAGGYITNPAATCSTNMSLYGSCTYFI